MLARRGISKKVGWAIGFARHHRNCLFKTFSLTGSAALELLFLVAWCGRKCAVWRVDAGGTCHRQPVEPTRLALSRPRAPVDVSRGRTDWRTLRLRTHNAAGRAGNAGSHRPRVPSVVSPSGSAKRVGRNDVAVASDHLLSRFGDYAQGLSVQLL